MFLNRTPFVIAKTVAFALRYFTQSEPDIFKQNHVGLDAGFNGEVQSVLGNETS
jgi:hypothetical protein